MHDLGSLVFSDLHKSTSLFVSDPIKLLGIKYGSSASKKRCSESMVKLCLLRPLRFGKDCWLELGSERFSFFFSLFEVLILVASMNLYRFFSSAAVAEYVHEKACFVGRRTRELLDFCFSWVLKTLPLFFWQFLFSNQVVLLVGSCPCMYQGFPNNMIHSWSYFLDCYNLGKSSGLPTTIRPSTRKSLKSSVCALFKPHCLCFGNAWLPVGSG